MGRLTDVVNYRKISEGNTEFRRSDYWLIEITPPPGIYFPGNELIQIRTTEFSPGISDDPNILTKQLRGYTVNQGARADKTSGSMDLTIQDRVDQTLSYFIDQWKIGMGDRDKLASLPKELVVAPLIKATYFNINEVAIRELAFFQCMLESGKLPEDGDGDMELESTITMSIAYEHFQRGFKNLGIVP